MDREAGRLRMQAGTGVVVRKAQARLFGGASKTAGCRRRFGAGMVAAVGELRVTVRNKGNRVNKVRGERRGAQEQ